jgi:hypothetical protein
VRDGEPVRSAQEAGYVVGALLVGQLPLARIVAGCAALEQLPHEAIPPGMFAVVVHAESLVPLPPGCEVDLAMHVSVCTYGCYVCTQLEVGGGGGP